MENVVVEKQALIVKRDVYLDIFLLVFVETASMF